MKANIAKLTLFLFLSSFTCYPSYSHPAKEMSLKTRPEAWFSHGKCSSLTINDYTHASDRTAARTRTVRDALVINRLMNKIAALPTAGEIMVSFAPTVPLVTLSFTCETGMEQVEFYGSSIKTPATSFYMGDNREAKEVFEQVQQLLAQ